MTGENVFADNATGYQDQCYAPTVARGLPFSSTHGNVNILILNPYVRI